MSGSRVKSIAFNQDAGLLASGSKNRPFQFFVFATSTWDVVATLTGHHEQVESFAFSPDSGLLASGSADSTVKVFATSTWDVVTTLAQHTGGVNGVAFNQGGGLLASCSEDVSLHGKQRDFCLKFVFFSEKIHVSFFIV
ncbi:unnamed protein product [Polarella glacialis]|uniref:RING-type E3 ubiquitin transferase n=1 Tax=Polarella glacialis TaxID=89957 RepID=A0A813I662_POLGL|nr:unnamed protein product [Polarella glacialis]CAE8680663.1 unnamed protein product [Polarella glacialis]